MKFYKHSGRILTGILTILGFTSCDPSEGPTEYGTPYAEHQIKGKVVNAENKGIKGIEVIIKNKNNDHSYLDTLHTDENGEITFNSSTSKQYAFRPEEEYRIYFNDIDGVNNGGLFQNDSIDLKTKETKDGKKGSWYTGKGEASFEKTLELLPEHTEDKKK